MNKWFPRDLDMFGHSNSETSQKAIAMGLKRWTNEEARAKYVQEISPLMTNLGLELPPLEFDRHIL